MESNLDKITKAVHRIEAAAQRQKTKAVKKTMKWLHQRKLEIEKQIEHLQSLVGMGPTKENTGVKVAQGGKRAKKRIRRSPEQLKSDAAKIAAFLDTHPNSKIAAIDKLGVNYGLSVKAFVKKHGGVKLKATGKSSATTYSLA